MRTKKSITEWIDKTDQEQLDYLNEKLLNWCSQIPDIHHLAGDFNNGSKYQRISAILEYLEENNHEKILRTVKQRWASKKNAIKVKSKFKFHTIRISPEADSALKELCCSIDSTSIHETIESIVLGQYQKNIDDIREKEIIKKKTKEAEKHNRKKRFHDNERKKRLSSSYIPKLKYNELKQELTIKENELEKALNKIELLKEKLTSKEASIDNHLTKICDFVEKLGTVEVISPNHKKKNELPIVNAQTKTPNTINDLDSIICKPK